MTELARAAFQASDEQIAAVSATLAEQGMCGKVAPDKSGLCLLDADHVGKCGWAIDDMLDKRLSAFFSVDRTPEEAAEAYLDAYNLRSDQLEDIWAKMRDIENILCDGRHSPGKRIQLALDILGPVLHG